MNASEQSMPPPTTNGAVSVSNGHDDAVSTQVPIQSQSQNQNQFGIAAQDEPQSISAGNLLFLE